MAYYDTINLVSGDDKPELNFTLRDSNTAAAGETLDEDDATTWAPIDLTDKNVVVHFRLLGSSTVLDTIDCTVSDAPKGKCYMHWSSTASNESALDVDAGTYEGEIEISNSDGSGKQTIFDKLKFKIRADFK